MKREGCQHGMVRSYRILLAPRNLRPNSRFVNRFDSPPAAGLFTKVPSRPTNHSKFTGKCTRQRCANCHLHLACKSKDKTKGNNKNKSFNVVLSHGLISWRVMDRQPGLNFYGLSATGWANHLAYSYEDYDDGKCEIGSEYEGERDVYDNGDHFIIPTTDGSKYKIHDGNNNDGEEDDDDDDKTSFYKVGYEWNQVEDGWCLVGEIDNPCTANVVFRLLEPICVLFKVLKSICTLHL